MMMCIPVNTLISKDFYIPETIENADLYVTSVTLRYNLLHILQNYESE